MLSIRNKNDCYILLNRIRSILTRPNNRKLNPGKPNNTMPISILVIFITKLVLIVEIIKNVIKRAKRIDPIPAKLLYLL